MQIAREWSHGSLCRSVWIATADHDPHQVWIFSRWNGPDYYEAAMDEIPRGLIEQALALVDDHHCFVRRYSICREHQFTLRDPAVAVLTRFTAANSTIPEINDWILGPSLQRLALPGAIALRHTVALDNSADFMSVGELEDPVAVNRVGTNGLRPPLHLRDYRALTGRVAFSWIWPGTALAGKGRSYLALGA